MLIQRQRIYTVSEWYDAHDDDEHDDDYDHDDNDVDDDNDDDIDDDNDNDHGDDDVDDDHADCTVLRLRGRASQANVHLRICRRWKLRCR